MAERTPAAIDASRAWRYNALTEIRTLLRNSRRGANGILGALTRSRGGLHSHTVVPFVPSDNFKEESLCDRKKAWGYAVDSRYGIAQSQRDD